MCWCAGVTVEPQAQKVYHKWEQLRESLGIKALQQADERVWG